MHADHDFRRDHAGLRRLRELADPDMIGAPDMVSRRSTTGRSGCCVRGCAAVLSFLMPGARPGWADDVRALTVQMGMGMDFTDLCRPPARHELILGAITSSPPSSHARARMTLLRMPLFVWTWLSPPYLLRR